MDAETSGSDQEVHDNSMPEKLEQTNVKSNIDSDNTTQSGIEEGDTVSLTQVKAGDETRPDQTTPSVLKLEENHEKSLSR